jgi:hypothetical protein
MRLQNASEPNTMSKIKRMNRMKIKLMVKRKALIKGEMIMMEIIKDQEQSYHIQESIKPCKGITLWTTFLVISKGVTNRSRDANFCKYYSFVSSLEHFKIEDALRDPNWVVAVQEELNNFK